MTNIGTSVLYLVLSVLGVLALMYVAMGIMGFIVEMRDDLRDRYTDAHWKPISLDWLFFPIWLLVELLCFLGQIALVLLTAYMALQVATAVRDWWHAGNKPGR